MFKPSVSLGQLGQLSTCVFMHAQSWLILCHPWTAAHQDPLSIEFSRQEYWNGLPFPTLGDIPNPVIEPGSPTFAGRFFTTEPPGNSIRGMWSIAVRLSKDRYSTCLYSFFWKVPNNFLNDTTRINKAK